MGEPGPVAARQMTAPLPSPEGSSTHDRDAESRLVVTALRRSEELYRLAVEGVRDYAIFLLDPEGRVASWNAGAERIKGYAADEIVGEHFSRFYPDETVQSGHPARELVEAEAQGRFEDEGWRVRKDGTRFWANVVITALCDEKGKHIGFLKITRDLTERMRAEENLRKSLAELESRGHERTSELAATNRALRLEVVERQRLERELRRRVEEMADEDRRKNVFLAALAHELRNPLAPIQYASNLLRMAGSDDHSRKQAEEIIERQLRHLVRLIDDLLDLSRIRQDKLELRPEPVSVADILEDALQAVRPIAESRGQRIHVRLPEPPVTIHADPTRLAQVFANLLGNASKFSETNSEIRLHAACRDGRLVVTVTDHGIGIAPDLLPYLFELFVQGERSLERASGGLGIGLTLVRRVVQMHGGMVEARSEGTGKGSEFTVTLPITLADPSGKTPTRPTEWPAGSRRILVVDDNPDTAESLAAMLRLMGHEALATTDGEEGVRLVDRLRPHLVFLDIGMPRLDGYEAARRIRETPWGNQTRLVAVTGWGTSHDRAHSASAGFDRHVVKPLDERTLRSLLDDLDAPGNPP